MAAKRIFKLKGSEPWLDRLAIMTELCLEMTPPERFAVLQYLITRHNQGEFTAAEKPSGPVSIRFPGDPSAVVPDSGKLP
jgi:hypothetical protein